MKTFSVVLEDVENEATFVFVCDADDVDHAREQATNAYPDSLVVGVYLA